MNAEITYNISKNLSAINSIDENKFSGTYIEYRLKSTGQITTESLEDTVYSNNISCRLIRIPYSLQNTPLSPKNIEDSLTSLYDISETTAGTYTGNWQILDRINTYLRTINFSLSTINQYLEDKALQFDDEDKVDPSIIDLSACIENVNQPATVFGLTDHAKFLHNTYNTLSNFYRLCCQSDTAVIYDKTEIDKCGYSFSLLNNDLFKAKNYAALMLDQNIKQSVALDDNQMGFDIKYECIAYPKFPVADISTAKKSKSIASCYQILFILNTFIQKLKNTKRFFIDVYHKQTSKKSFINGVGKLIQTLGSKELEMQGHRVQISISPYIQQTVPSTDDAIRLIGNKIEKIQRTPVKTDTTIEDDNTTLNIDNIVYDASSGASTPQIIPLISDRTNGIFAHELKTIKTDLFQLTIQDIQKMFGITQNSIISRKSILNAIDYIFSYWTKNMSYIEYIVTTCHANCHNNEAKDAFDGIIKTKYTYPIQETVYLHYTGGCGCSTIRNATVNFSKYKPANAQFNNAKLYYSVSIGGYYENTQSPEICQISYGSNPAKIISNSGGGINSTRKTYSGLNISDTVGGIVSLYAHENDELDKTSKKYFCIAVTLYTSYSIETEIST